MKIRDMVIKDLKVALSDRSAILLLLVMPIVLMAILGLSLTFSFDDASSLEKIKIAIVKEYNPEEEIDQLLQLISQNTSSSPDELDLGDFDLEKIFFDDFLGNVDLKNIIEYQILDKEDANKMLQDKKVTAIVILPKGFIKDTMINFGTTFRNVVDIQVIGRTDKNIGTTIVEEIMRGFTDMLNYNISAKNSFVRLYSSLGFEEDVSNHIELLTEKIQKILSTERPDVQYEALNNRPPMNSRAYYAFAMTAMFILYSAGYGSKILLEEKDIKTYDRMSASGVEQSTIVIGKAFTIFLVILIQSIISLTFSSLVLGVDWGNIINVLIIFIFSSISVAGLGIMLSAVVYKSGSYNMANVFTSFIVQVMAVFGGSMVPLEVMPGAMRIMSNFVPNGLMLKSLMKNYYGYGLNQFVVNILALGAMGLIFMVIATIILKKGGKNHVKHTAVEAHEA